MSIELREWVGLLRNEYLMDFTSAGGAAVKIAVAPPHNAPAVANAVDAAARDTGHFVARVDAAQTRVHMIDQIFYQVSRQVDWDGITRRWLRDLLTENGVAVPDESALHDMEALAAANGRERRELLGEINRLIENSTLQNYALNREFRTAMAMLCWGVVNPQNVSPSDSDLIKNWLRGEKAGIAGLKRVQIYGRIGRHNARLMLASLVVWLHRTGYAGMLLLLDLNAVVTPPSPDQATLRYTRSTLLDAYEVLRQFIDDTDEMSHLLVVAIAGPGLLDDAKRNVDNYTALKLRIVDEVHDRNRSNPLNAMVRLANTDW